MGGVSVSEVLSDDALATLATHAALLRRLHDGPKPLVLANAWDVASARAVVAEGFPVVATSSSAVARAIGFDDNDSMPVDEAFGAVSRIARNVEVPVTADIEAGYRLAPNDLVDRLLSAGAVGCNIEDTDHHGGERLLPADAHAERLAAIKTAARSRGVDIVLNARVDVFRRDDVVASELMDEAVARARVYREAGADCVYPIRLSDERLIEIFRAEVGDPVNILVAEVWPTLARFVQLGVPRLSFAGGLFRSAYATLAAQLEAISQQLPEVRAREPG